MISIIVLNYNQWKFTLDCINSLLKLEEPNFQIIVVDNGSTDGSEQILKEEFGNKITLLCSAENLGFSGGNNIAIRYALINKSEYVLLLNNDTLVDPEFLGILIKAANDDSQVAAVNPKIYFMHDRNRIWAAGGELNLALGVVGNRGEGQTDLGQFDFTTQVDYGTGCCLLMKSEALRTIGLLNESYFAYFEDADWSLRAINKGYKILYIPEAKIWHAAGASSKGFKTREGTTRPRVHYLNARNQLWFLRTHTQGWKRVTAITGYLIHRITLYSAIFLLLRRFEKLKALWQGFRDGLTSVPEAPRVMNGEHRLN